MASNILLDVTQDSEKNTFSKRMKTVYEDCVTDNGGPGITKRSLDRIEEFLQSEGHNSAFATVARRVTSKFLRADEKHMKDIVKEKVGRLLHRLFVSVDELLDNKVEDETEADIRVELVELLPMLFYDWEQASEDLQAVKEKYEQSSQV